MFCSGCGSQIKDGSAFCGNCGKGVATGAQQAAAAPQPAGAPSVQPAVQPIGGAPEHPAGAPGAQYAPAVAQPAGAPGSHYAPAVAQPAAPAKKKPIVPIIAIIAIAVIAACLYFFVFSVQPVYRSTVQEYYENGELSQTARYTLFENGAAQTMNIDKEGEDPKSYVYYEIGDGVTINDNQTGKYATDSNGDVTYIETASKEDPSNITIIEYTYYKPGIINTSLIKWTSPIGTLITNTYTYNEDGWPINSSTTYDYSSGDSETYSYRYEYEFALGGKSVMVKTYTIDSSEVTTKRLVLDDHGSLLEIYLINSDGSETLQERRSAYIKIDHPAKCISATSRLHQL